jgi:hypothetical protein
MGGFLLVMVTCGHHVETDTWSPLWLDQFVVDLGYLMTGSLKMFRFLPGKTLADGLRLVSSDSDTNAMASRVKNLVIYFDHEDSLVTLDWDDVITNPAIDLPKVMIPKKLNFIPKKDGEKLPSFYSNLETSNEAQGTADEKVTVAALIVMRIMKTF